MKRRKSESGWRDERKDEREGEYTGAEELQEWRISAPTSRQLMDREIKKRRRRRRGRRRRRRRMQRWGEVEAA